MKFDLTSLVRPNVLKMQPYSSARSEFTGIGEVFLDANENPYGTLNRYPDPLQSELKSLLAERNGVVANQIFVGNGSDEVIDLAFRIFCQPGRDKVLVFPPTYGMYAVSAALNEVEMVEVPLTPTFEIDLEATRPLLIDPNLKLIFLCSPNNPTGNQIPATQIEALLAAFSGLVIVDEAYIDFAEEPSAIELLAKWPNLLISQTMSKAWGLAAARVGLAYASSDIITLFNKVKPPYNVSQLNQQAAIRALKNTAAYEQQKAAILREKEWLKAELANLSIIQKIYPSAANFLLVEIDQATAVYERLKSQGIIVRNRDKVVPGCLRITVGTPLENRRLIAALKGESEDGKNATDRSLFIQRDTSETQISLYLNLDGTGHSQIDTGIGFFDHMLDQIARHGGIDLEISVNGDLEVDPHHTIEDVALTLGSAVNQALGDKKGIERYAFLLPMDDCLAQVALDFGGRPWLVWEVEFKREKLGEMPTEMFYHFFKSFCDTAKCNLNLKAEGENEHHKIESLFKAFARTLKTAKSVTNGNAIPSTKGIL